MKVYYVKANGEKEIFTLDEDQIENGYAVFNTNHFSIYTLGYAENGIENPKTFDGIGTSLIMVIASLIGLVGATIYLKRNKERA